MISFKTITMSLVLSSGMFSVAMGSGTSNTDCYLTISELRASQGCIFVGDGLPCTSWIHIAGSGPHIPLTRVSPTRYEVENAEYDLRAQADWQGKIARISIITPYTRISKVVPVIADQYGSAGASVQAEYKNKRTERGLSYQVRCSFGLSDRVNAIKERENAEMDRLGPAAVWPDESAALLVDMPVGTILELKNDFEISPKSNGTFSVLAEGLGLTSKADFLDQKLPFRFAFAEMFNRNNGYIYSAFYPQGMKLRLLRIEVAGDTQLYFETVADPNVPAVKDPIVRMMLSGRRSQKNTKIPQFAEMVSPLFKVILP